MGNFNRQSPTLLGSEWRPQSGRQVVLSSTNRAVAMRIVPGAVTVRDVDLYIESMVGTPGIGIEILSTLTPTFDSPSVIYPGTNTGATKSDWVDEAGGTSDYTDLDQQTFDGTHYLKPNSSKEIRLLFRPSTAIAAGKRVLSIKHSMLARWPGIADGGVKGFHYSVGRGTQYPALRGVLTSSSVEYNTGLVPSAPVSQFTTFSSPTMWIPPSGTTPWTLTQANNLTNGTDTFGLVRDASIYTQECHVAGMWLEVQTCPENRQAAYYSLTAPKAGWQRYTLTGPDGGAVSACSAATDYWLVVYTLQTAGGASVTLRALTDETFILSSTAGSGERRQTYDLVTDRGAVTDSSARPGELLAALVETSTSTWIGDSNPYTVLTPLEVSAGPSQQVTASSGTSYSGVRLNVGWESTNLRSGTSKPDAPLSIEVQSGAGAPTGAGTIVATATVQPDQLRTGGLTDVQVPFSAAFTSATTQYSVFFRSVASTDRSWVVGQLDTHSDVVSTITAANVEATGIGGTTDSYQTTAGTATSRYDVPVMLIPTVTAPGSLTATVVAAQ